MSENFIGIFECEEKIIDDIHDFWAYHKKYALPGRTFDNEKSIEDHDVKQSKDLPINAETLCFPFDNYRVHLQESLEQYIKLYNDVDGYTKFDIYEPLNIQWYPKGGGFKKWHFERTFPGKQSERVLVFMTYLNDVDDGGTEFLYQNLKTKAIKGLTLLWPTDFTHTHRGTVSMTKEKYIVTGWYSYNESLQNE